MICYMKNFDFIRVISNKDETMLFNENNYSSAIISKEVYELIQDIKGIGDYDEIAKQYSKDDQIFFNELRRVFVEKKLFENKAENSERYLRIDYVITDYCNLLCRHCCYSAQYLPSNSNAYRIDKELDILDRIIALEPDAITITGGEPLTISNFDEVENRIAKSGIKSRTLQTNATLISEDNISGLVRAFNTFDISLDGSTPEETEEIRGTGVYEKVINAIKLLKKNNIKNILLSCAMNLDENEKRVRFEELCKKLGVKPIVRQMTYAGRAASNGLKTNDKTEQYFYSKAGEYCSCGAGRTEITVNNKGDVFPCPNFIEKKFMLGNIFDDKIINRLGWDRENDWYKHFSQYVSTERDECAECEVNIFCWHCPFQIKRFMEINDIKSLMKICERKKQIIYRRLWDNEEELLN